jgi:hypothetical protein
MHCAADVPSELRTESNGGALFTVRPEPWRILKMYFWLAFALTAGPLLFGLWSGVVGYFLTQCTLGEVWERCVELVGYAPFLGIAVVALSFPAGWVLLGAQRRQCWSVDAGGISVLDGDRLARRIPWCEIDTVRVGVGGPLVMLKDRTQEGEELFFVPREASVRLHQEWSKHRI